MARIDPAWVTVRIIRANETLEVRVGFDKKQLIRAIEGSAADQNACCIQVRKALRKRFLSKTGNHLPANWPGFVEWSEVRLSIARALKKLLESADVDAIEEMLETEYNSTFLPTNSILFDH